MSSSAPAPGERIVDVEISSDALRVELADGRSLSAPLAWYPRLAGATAAERERWELAGGGYGIHWPDVDEDLSVRGLLEGRPAPGGRARPSS
ncbi:MAG TPA: DUF2442 domain-containing protein, partial [Gemmatimonadota bacterium]|nr:DUF2442 domain-containing protein [Gemmatimonadota bacterium]